MKLIKLITTQFIDVTNALVKCDTGSLTGNSVATGIVIGCMPNTDPNASQTVTEMSFLWSDYDPGDHHSPSPDNWIPYFESLEFIDVTLCNIPEDLKRL